MSSRHKKSRSRPRPHADTTPSNAYPPLPPGYPVSAPQWLPPYPNYPYQWYPPWPAMPPTSAPGMTWAPPAPPVTSAAPGLPQPPPDGGADEYTVDSLRRIYNDDDGSIEIERVKVQRRPGIYGVKAGIAEGPPSEDRSLVPVGAPTRNERRPPPRKNRKRAAPELPPKRDVIPQGWYPYVPYMPQPYPYQYGYMWPVSPLPALSPGFHSPTSESDASLPPRAGEVFAPSTPPPDSIGGKSLSPELRRPSSSGATSHVLESLGTDIAPSDSVSMRGFRREASFERVLRESLDAPGGLEGQRGPEEGGSSDAEKTKEWMEGMQRAFDSQQSGDRSSFATASSDIPPLPPSGGGRAPPEGNPRHKISHRKSNSESNVDDPSDQGGLAHPPLLDSTRVSDSDLIYSFRRVEPPPANPPLRSGTPPPPEGATREGRVSRTSTMSFHSTQQSADDTRADADTDSTDIAVPIDSSSTADESVENFGDDKEADDPREESYKWILQIKAGAENLESGGEKEVDDFIEKWRTEVSLWRARLVVSLCRGQGLDQQDWATFQLLVQHPLPMDLKLSLLHARRLCSSNYDVGVAMLRNALLHLTSFGEALMKPEGERASGWKTISIDASQPWVPMKGSNEILRVLGYRLREDGTLRYKSKFSPEISVIARLTLDILVLAEEFRLFLTGAHQYPANITQLFTSRDIYGDKHMTALHHAEKQKHHSCVDLEQEEINSSQAVEQSCNTNGHDPSNQLIDKQYFSANEQNVVYPKKRVAPLPPSDSLSQNSSSFHTEEICSSNNPIDIMSLPASDTLSSTTSIPELHSPSQISFLNAEDSVDKETGSRETLTPSPTTEGKSEESIIDQSKKEAETSIEENTDTTENKPKRTSRKGDGKDNPEDHIYEEIGDIKAQVEALKDKSSTSGSPPPLPAKTKSSFDSQDIYPHMEWSISSQYSSIHGGSSTRRKKRRAPMPPEFFNQEATGTESKVSLGEFKENKNLPLTSEDINQVEVANSVDKEGLSIQNDVNGMITSTDSIITVKAITPPISSISESLSTPTEEESFIDTINNAQSTDTPTRIKSEPKKELPFDGNPFYEERIKPIGFIGKNPFYEDVNGKFVSTPPAITDESLQLKDDSNNDPENIGKTVTELKEISKSKLDTEDVSEISEVSSLPGGVRPQRRKGKGSTLKRNQTDSTDKYLNESKASSDEKSSDNTSSTSVVTIKNVANESPPQLPTKTLPRNFETKSLKQITYKKNEPREPQPHSQVVVPIKNLEHEGKTNIKENIPKKDIILQKISITYDISLDDSTSSTSKSPRRSPAFKDQPLKTAEYSKVTKVLNAKASEPAVESNLKKTSEEDATRDNIKSDGVQSPPLPPPKAALRLIDDIPYIDNNDVKKYKSNYDSLDRQQPQHFGLSEMPTKDETNFTISNAEGKASTFLKISSDVPFIDDSDVPPESAPPPPPNPLPPTPPLLPPPSPPPLSPSSSPILQSSASPPPLSPPTPPLLPPPTPPPTLLPLSQNDSLPPLSKDPTVNECPTDNISEIPQDSLLPFENEIEREKMEDVTHASVQEEVKAIGSLETPTEATPEHVTSDSNSDTEHKAAILFRKDGKQRTPELYNAQSESRPHEILEPTKTTAEFEERYEIPDVTRANANATAAKLAGSRPLERRAKEDGPPRRPPRHLLLQKVPPRPPKPIEKEGPPRLPPKTGGTKPPLSASLPSTLVKTSKADSSAPFSPSYRSSPSSKTLPPKASSLSSLHGARPSSAPLGPASMPSSPKISKSASRLPKKKEDAKQRSWPALLCECVNPRHSDEDIKRGLH